MTFSRLIAWRVAAAALAAALVWPAVASGQDDVFRRGLDARNDKQWKTVVTEMRTVIANDPKESTRTVSGGFLRLRGMEYLPHYFLGEALFQLQDCVGAVEAWSISEQQGAVRVRKEFLTVIADGYQKCGSRGVLPPSEFTTQQAATRQAVTDVTALAERVTKLGPEVWRPENHEQYTRAGAELQAAQARFAAGTRARSASEFTEARAAATRATAMLRNLESALNANIENLTFVSRQAREVETLITGAESGDRAIDGVKVELTPALAASRQSGRDLVARARERVRAGEKAQSAAMVNEGLRAAQDATAVFSDVLDQATRIAGALVQRELSEVATMASEALSFLDLSFATVTRLEVEKPAVAPPDMATRREALQKRIAALRRRFETAQKTQNIAGVRDVVRLAGEARGELDTLITAFGPVTLRDRGVHAALEEGARLFLTGEYQQALTALDATTLGDAPLQLHVHVFRAAALYHLFVRSGEQDEAVRTQALAEIDACKRLAPDFRPDAKAFGPRFLAFFQNPSPSVTP